MKNQLYIPIEQLTVLRNEVLQSKRIIDSASDKDNLILNLYMGIILPLIEIYQPIISSLATHNSDIIYRARKCRNNIPFNNIKDLYNPPTSSGRSYISDTIPILYASSSSQTALSEIEVKVGDLVNIALFRYSNILSGKFWFVGQLGAFFKSQEQSRYLSDETTVQKPFYATSQRATNSLVFKDCFFNEIFSTLSTNTDNYALNRFLLGYINKNHSRDSDLSGVVFISSKGAPGVNFAIYGDAIKKLEKPSVVLVKITYIDDYGCISFKMLGHPKNEGDSLLWSEYH